MRNKLKNDFNNECIKFKELLDNYNITGATNKLK